jgi:hypothetical protein
MTNAPTPLDQLLDELADRLYERLETRRRAGARDMVDQDDSPLGPRRHCRAVARRLASGEPGALKLGRRQLLTRQALAEELERLAKRRAAKTAAAASEQDPVQERLERRLRLLHGA